MELFIESLLILRDYWLWAFKPIFFVVKKIDGGEARKGL